jgi:hypothetical protein
MQSSTWIIEDDDHPETGPPALRLGSVSGLTLEARIIRYGERFGPKRSRQHSWRVSWSSSSS